MIAHLKSMQACQLWKSPPKNECKTNLSLSLLFTINISVTHPEYWDDAAHFSDGDNLPADRVAMSSSKGIKEDDINSNNMIAIPLKNMASITFTFANRQSWALEVFFFVGRQPFKKENDL